MSHHGIECRLLRGSVPAGIVAQLSRAFDGKGDRLVVRIELIPRQVLVVERLQADRTHERLIRLDDVERLAIAAVGKPAMEMHTRLDCEGLQLPAIYATLQKAARLAHPHQVCPADA